MTYSNFVETESTILKNNDDLIKYYNKYIHIQLHFFISILHYIY